MTESPKRIDQLLLETFEIFEPWLQVNNNQVSKLLLLLVALYTLVYQLNFSIHLLCFE